MRLPRQYVLIDCITTEREVGSIMSWVDVTTAVGTAAAAVVALGLGLRAELRATRIERQRNELEIRRQATQVAAWMIVERHRDGERVEADASDPSLDALDPSYDPRGVHVCVIVQNASDQPVWDVMTHIPGFVPKKGSSDKLESTYFEDEQVVVGPREAVRIPVEGYNLSYNRLPIEIEFRDNAGREWRRDDRGRLHTGRRSPGSWAWLDELADEKKQHDKHRRAT
jgi:hypothetical protein